MISFKRTQFTDSERVSVTNCIVLAACIEVVCKQTSLHYRESDNSHSQVASHLLTLCSPLSLKKWGSKLQQVGNYAVKYELSAFEPQVMEERMENSVRDNRQCLHRHK